MSQCVICLENINGNKKTLQCGHTFHTKCIQKWLKKNKTCPICRCIQIQKRKKRKKKPFPCVMCYNITACTIAVASSPFILMYAFYKELQDSTVRIRRRRGWGR